MAKPKEQEVYVSPLEAGTLPTEVRAEVEKIRMDGYAWTEIHPLRKGVDDPSGHTCDGSQGNHNVDCLAELIGVQYNVQGEPQFYCEKHGIEQDEWDRVFYRSKPRPHPEMSEEDHKEVQKILAKIGRKKKKREEPEELDPTA